MPRTKKIVKTEVNAMAPRDFTDALIAGFEEPQKAVHNIGQIIDMYSNELEVAQLEVDKLRSKLQHLTEIRDMLERRAAQQEDQKDVA